MSYSLTTNDHSLTIGDDRARTGNLRLAKPALSQLSYVPGLPLRGNLKFEISDLKLSMGPGRFELPTSRLSGVRSNRLSYEPPSLRLTMYYSIGGIQAKTSK